MSREWPPRHPNHHIGRRHLDGKPGDWTYTRDEDPESNEPFVRGQIRNNLDTPPEEK